MRATQNFLRIEAVEANRTDVADPQWLHVRVTPADDINTEIEAFLLPSTNPHGINPTAKRPFRLYTGTWAVDLEPGKYEPGKQYTISWRFSMTPDNLNVTRTQFVWDPIPTVPREGGCILFGTVIRNMRPVAETPVIVEEYSNLITLTQRTSQVTVKTDAFGQWWLEVPRNSSQRVIYLDTIETITVGDLSSLSLSDAPEWQIGDVAKDSYGYPIPTTGGGAGLAGKNEAIELLGIKDCGLPPGNIDTLLPEDPNDIPPLPKPPTCCRYEHVQSSPSSVWVVNHNLNGHPSVTVVDASGDTVFGDIRYTSPNTLTITFLMPELGHAYID